MIFETLKESSEKGELLLVAGGYARFHRRRDGQVTLHELLVLPEKQRQGVGRSLIEAIREKCPNASCLLAKCPSDLPANAFYARMGFEDKGEQTLPSGRKLRTWILPF
jgi:GNAT superfamily N-acetyltransferase